MTKFLGLDAIRIDGGTQMRAAIDADTVAEYAAAWKAKATFPALVVFFDGTDTWLADGFHRYHGARAAELNAVPVDIRPGTQREAQHFAAKANQTHGLKRTNACKRRSVCWYLNDKTCVEWSDNKIAEDAGVSQNFVSEVRKQLTSDVSSPAAAAASQPRVGRDGKKRKAPEKKPPKAARSAEPQQENFAPAAESQDAPPRDGPCPRGGDHEFGDEGDCEKCHEPEPQGDGEPPADHMLRKDAKATPKNGRATWSDKPIEEQFRKFIRGIDDFRDKMLTMLKDRAEIVGGKGAVVQAKLNKETESMHDAVNRVYGAFKEWVKA